MIVITQNVPRGLPKRSVGCPSFAAFPPSSEARLCMAEMRNCQNPGGSEQLLILITGGAYQGKKAYAKKLLAGREDIAILSDYQERVREQLGNGCDPIEELKKLLDEQPGVCIICNDVGSGVVPVGKAEREWREAVGRVMCEAAALAAEVHRVVYGIGRRIK